MSEDDEAKAFKPKNIAVAGRELAVAWADGHESYYPFDELRRHCPCALCRAAAEKAVREGPLRVARGPAPGAITIVRFSAVGAYAVQVTWSDGHDEGIFAFESLRRACPCPECSSRPGAGWR